MVAMELCWLDSDKQETTLRCLEFYYLNRKDATPRKIKSKKNLTPRKIFYRHEAKKRFPAWIISPFQMFPARIHRVPKKVKRFSAPCARL
jgi:hypothetical protein